ncbi:MAG: transposase, partial [Hydrogenobacter sp.]
IVKFIIEYIEKNLEIQQIHKKRGRPAIYHTKLILTALILKTFLKLSFRDTQDLLEDLFPDKPIPDFSTLFYRFKNLDKQLVSLRACMCLRGLQCITFWYYGIYTYFLRFW